MANLRPPAPKGFTLVELLVVLAIVAVLCTVSVTSYSGFIQKAEASSAVRDIRFIEREINKYKVMTGCYPANLSAIGLGNMKDTWGRPYVYLRIADGCISGNSGNSGQSGHGGNGRNSGTSGNSGNGGNSGGVGMFRKDRWNNPLNTDYDLYSCGPDGETSTQLTAQKARDDIVRAANGDFVGIAADY